MSYQEDRLKEIADAIREKKGSTDVIKASSFADEIRNLSSDDMLQYIVNNNGCSYLLNYYKDTDVSFISKLDTSNVTEMNYMFDNCFNITSIPQLNTSNVTNMANMFNNCRKLTSIPQLDTSKVTSMSTMFGYCENLETIPQLNTSNVLYMNSMFYYCRKLTSIPQLDTSKITSMSSMFSACSLLETIPALNVSNVTNFSGTFSSCRNLKSILMYGMKSNFDISSSTLFERSDLLTILNNLATVTSATLTMGSTNLAKLTSEDQEIAIAKGWSLK